MVPSTVAVSLYSLLAMCCPEIAVEVIQRAQSKGTLARLDQEDSSTGAGGGGHGNGDAVDIEDSGVEDIDDVVDASAVTGSRVKGRSKGKGKGSNKGKSSSPRGKASKSKSEASASSKQGQKKGSLDEHFTAPSGDKSASGKIEKDRDGPKVPAVNESIGGFHAVHRIMQAGGVLAGIEKLGCDPYGSRWAETLGGDCRHAVFALGSRITALQCHEADATSSNDAVVDLSSDSESDGDSGADGPAGNSGAGAGAKRARSKLSRRRTASTPPATKRSRSQAANGPTGQHKPGNSEAVKNNVGVAADASTRA